MKTNDIVIIGSGGFGREVLCLLMDINSFNIKNNIDLFNIVGFVNNDKSSYGNKIMNIPVLGDEQWIVDYYLKHKIPINVAMGIGQPHIKRKIITNLGAYAKWPNLIHPNVVLSKWITMGYGNIITAGNVLTCNIDIRNHTMINLSGTIGHDSVINDYSVISPGVNVSGNVNIGEGAYIGTGAKILEKINIGKWATVGGNALVNKDVDDNSTVVGVPAKSIKVKKDGWHL